MKVVTIAVCLALFASPVRAERAKECPALSALRCRKNVVERCFDDGSRGVRWVRDKTCRRPEACVEDRPFAAKCSADSRLKRRLLDAAVVVIGGAWIASGGIKRMLQ